MWLQLNDNRNQDNFEEALLLNGEHGACSWERDDLNIDLIDL